MNQEAEKMINEFLEKAKTQEDVEKLNLKDLDGYSGGSETINMNGVEVSPDQFNNMFLSMAESFDFDTAVSIFSQYCGGFQCVEMTKFYTWNARNSEKDKMALILHKYWQYMETGKIY